MADGLDKVIEEVTAEAEVPAIEAVVVKPSHEERAVAKGWKPKAEFEGDPEEWVDARSFNRSGELMQAISSLKRERKADRDAIELLLKQNRDEAELAYKQAEIDLKAKHRASVEIGDIAGADSAVEELLEMRKAPERLPTDDVMAEVQAFAERNKEWFNKSNPDNIAMSAYAQAMEEDLLKNHPEHSYRDVLKLVESKVQEKMGKRKSSPDVAAVAAPSGSKKIHAPHSISELPKMHQDAIRRFRSYKGFDEQAYIARVLAIPKGGSN